MVDRLYEHILVPTDFRPVAREAYRVALALAQGSNARITLLHVLPEKPDEEFSGLNAIQLLHRAADRTLPRWDPRLTPTVEKREATLNRLKGEIHPDWLSSLPVSIEVRSGNVIEEIVSQIKESQVDLVVMASSRAKWASLFRLSVADQLSRRTSVKVVRVVPPVRVTV